MQISDILAGAILVHLPPLSTYHHNYVAEQPTAYA